MRYRVVLIVGCAWLAGCVSGVARDINGEADRMRLGQEAMTQRDFARAREHFEVALREAPDNVDAMFKLGNIALYQGRTDDAVGLYNDVLERDPQYARAHYNLAVIHLGRAEDHFNFYAATLEGGSAIDDNLVRLLADIDAFANKKEAAPVVPADPLDSLGELLGSGGTPK